MSEMVHTKEGLRPRVCPSDRIVEALEKSRWDGLVVLGIENVQYCTGVWIPYARMYLDRPNIVVWPAGSEPILVTGAELISGIAPRARVQRFVGFEEKGAAPPAVIVDTVADVIRQEGLERGVLGLEMLRTPVAFYQRLRELLPGARFEPADDLLRRLRMVKTHAEIEALTAAAQLTDAGIAQAFQTAGAGQSEREVGAGIQLHALENGASFITTLLVGAGEGARALSWPTDRPLEAGDMVRMDMTCVCGGYFADIGRMAVVGEPTAAQEREYQIQLALNAEVCEFIRPGRTCAEVHAFYLEQADRMGAALFIYPYIGVGHGIGINADELPKLNSGDNTIIEAGMVLNVEPDTIGADGDIFHVEDTVLVTERGTEVISRSRDWSALPVIAV